MNRGLLTPLLILVGALVIAGAAFLFLRSDEPPAVETSGETQTSSDESAPENPAPILDPQPLADPTEVTATRDVDDSEVPLDETQTTAASGRGPGEFHIRGRVVLDETGEPVAGATVGVWRKVPPFGSIRIDMALQDTPGRIPAAEHSVQDRRARPSDPAPENPWGELSSLEVRADQNGHFTLEGIPTRSFTLTAKSKFRVAKEHPFVQLESPTDDREVEIRLVPAAGITGRVFLPDGSPAIGATVSMGTKFDPMSVLDGGLDMRAPGTTTTDSKGEFGLTSVPGELTYQVRARLAPYGPTDFHTVEIVRGETAQAELHLSEPNGVEVLVEDPEGQPLPGAYVILFPQNLDFGKITVDGGGFDDLDATTDEDGKVHLSGIQPQKYRLTVTHPDYEDDGEGTATVEKGQILSRTVRLGTGRRLTGSVVDRDGQPIADAYVRAFEKPSLFNLYDQIRTSQAPWKDVEPDGQFQLGGMPEGSLQLEAGAPGFMTTTVTTDDKTDVTVTLPRRATIEGIVLSRISGKPIRDYEVKLEQKVGMMQSFGQGGNIGKNLIWLNFQTEKGKFRILDAAPGRYRLHVRAVDHAEMKGDWVDVAEGQSMRGLLFYLTPAAAIEGIVRDADTGRPVPGASVAIKAGDGNFALEITEKLLGPSGEKTAEDGSFRLSGLAAGLYDVEVTHDDYADALLAEVKVGVGQLVTGQVVRLEHGAEVFGHVYQDGQPVKGSKVFAVQQMPMKFHTATSEADGSYRLTGLSPGAYQLSRMPGDFSLDVEDFMQKFVGEVETHNVKLEAGDRLEQDFGVAAAGSGVIVGTVRQGGEPFQGAVVSVVGPGEGVNAQNFSGTHAGFSGNDGTFTIKRLPAGRSMLVVTTMSQSMPGVGTSVSRDVEVLAGATVTVDIDLPVGTIRGRVTDASTRAPQSGVAVYASRENSGGQVGFQAMTSLRAGQAFTNDEGEFVLQNLAPGSYSVTAGGGHPMAPSDRGLARVSGIAMADGADVNVGDIELPTPGIVVGQVTDGNGNPVPNASIFLRQADAEFLQVFSWVVTDSTGNYSYAGVPPGTYDVLCRASGRATAVQRGVPIEAGGSVEVNLVSIGGTEVVVVLGAYSESDLQGLSLEVYGPQGRIPLGLVGLSDLLEGGLTLPEPGVFPLGCYGPGTYHLRGTAGGKTIEREFVLAGEPELRIPIGS